MNKYVLVAGMLSFVTVTTVTELLASPATFEVNLAPADAQAKVRVFLRDSREANTAYVVDTPVVNPAYLGPPQYNFGSTFSFGGKTVEVACFSRGEQLRNS